MTRNRDELKVFFSDGALPTGAHFADLIDSMALKRDLDAQAAAFESF